MANVSYYELNKEFGHRSTEFYENQFALGKEYRELHDGFLPPTPFWTYLEERRAIDPARFDRWHPRIGKWISEIPTIPTCPPPSCPIVCTPPPCDTGAVAEPSTNILMIIAVIIVAVFRRCLS